MKAILTLCALTASATLAGAQCCAEDGANSRAAAMTGATQTASTEKAAKKDDCCGGCEDKTSLVHLSVSGMSCGGCEKGITAALEKIDGVTVKKVCHKGKCVKAEIDPAKTNAEAVAKAVTDKGFTVDGEVVSMKVDGMTCSNCEKAITAELEKLEGVTVKKVCHKSGHAAVLVKGDATDKAAIEKAITDKGFTVGK